MKKLLIAALIATLVVIWSLMPIVLFSQSIGIGTTTPDSTAKLDISSNSKGLLIPRLTTGQRMAILNPTKGLIVYDSTARLFYWHDGTAWQGLATSANTWALNGNNGTNPVSNFIGTGDNKPLQFRVNNIKSGLLDHINKNVVLGSRAGLNMSTAANQNTIIGDSAFYQLGIADMSGNTVIGYGAQSQADSATTLWAGVNYNTVVGLFAGTNNTGAWNTIVGEEAGMNNRGLGNVFMGSKAGMMNTTGDGNTFVGNNAGRDDSTGGYNSFFGNYSGQYNNGSYNSFFGMDAGYNHRSGWNNVFLGTLAGYSDTSGNNNVFAGQRAGQFNLSGNNNVAVGNLALYQNRTGHNNTAIGGMALYNNSVNSNLVAVGDSALYNNYGIGAINNAAVGSKSLYRNP